MMRAQRIPVGFSVWVAVSVAAELGAGMLAFALTWVGSGYGPQIASLVLTLTIAPSVLFGLLGGATADRFGAHRMMILGTCGLGLISGLLAMAVVVWGSPPGLLFAAAALIGTVSAFYRPAVGVFPRLFVDDDVLGAAMARVGVAAQLARTAAPPLRGLIIGLVPLSGVAAIDVVGCVAMLVVLVLVRPPRAQDLAAEAMTLQGIGDGLRTAWSTPGVRALLAAVGIVAGAVIPAVILGVPLAARERGWSAAEAGLIEAGWIGGGILVGAWFAARGTARRAWIPMAVGPVIIALGLLLLAVSELWPAALVSTTIVGGGVVVFTAHVFPTYILLAPPAMLSRFQSLLILVQQVPQLVVFPLIGIIVAGPGTVPMIAGAAGAALLASGLILRDRSLRDSASPPLR